MDQPDHTPAELDRRFYAFAIDRAIAWGLMTAVGYVAYVRYLDDDQVGVGIGVIAGGVVAISLVFAVVLGLTGASPGKALVGLRVVRVSDGRPIGVPHAVLRTAVLGMFTVPTAGIGLATLAFTAVMDPGGWRRGGHDRMTDAVVVDARPVPQVEPDDDAPPQLVNLTAMRLMPAPANPPLPAPAPVADPPPVTAPDSPPPARRREQRLPPPPPAPPARHAAPLTASWRVAFDSGETFLVEGLALVGRRPEPRPGEPVRHVVPLRSSDMSVSKTHAQFQVVPDGALVVMDRGSTNGSVVVRQGVPKSLTAGRPATLLDGDVVRFGDRTMTVTQEKTP